MPKTFTLWFENDTERFPIPEVPNYLCHQLRGITLAPAHQPFIMVGDVHYNLPQVDADLGQLDLCNYCPNQLACVARNSEAYLNPENMTIDIATTKPKTLRKPQRVVNQGD